MSSMSVEVTASDYHFRSELNSRITFVIGDSGVGKTSLVDAIEDSNTGLSVVVKCEKEFLVLAGTMGLSTILDNIRIARNRLIVLDDEIFTTQKEFYSAYYKSDKSNWFMIFARDTSNLFKREDIKLNNLHYGISSYKEFFADGIEHWLEDYFVEDVNYSIMVDKNYSNVEILTEDAGSGLQMVQGIFPNCDCRPFGIKNSVGTLTYGKDIIIKDVSEIIESGFNRSAYVLFIDMSAFGPYIFKLENLFELSKCEDYFVYIYSYECLEYMLLKSKFVSAEKLHYSWDNAVYETFEKYCEKMLDDLTACRRFSQKHNRALKDCWTKDCGYLQECNHCDDFVKTGFDKINWLFYKTKFHYIVILRELIKDKFVWDECEDEDSVTEVR